MPIPGLEPKQFVSEQHLHRAYTRMATVPSGAGYTKFQAI
jgi:hypothetical protein